MQRTVAAAVVAGLIGVSYVAVAASLPRFDCPAGFSLVVDTDHSRSEADLICEEDAPMILPDHFAGTPGTRLAEVSDRLWLRVAIANAGLVLGATLFVFARAESRRPSSFDPMAQE